MARNGSRVGLVCGLLCVVAAVTWISGGISAGIHAGEADATPPVRTTVDAPHLPADDSAPRPTPLTKRAPDDPLLRDILRLHQQHGSVLKGTLLERAGEGEREFGKLFRALAKSPPPTRVPLQGSSPLVPPGADHELVSALRYAGRLLDEKSNDLETTRAYREADALRDLATRLRCAARGLDRSPTTPDLPQAPSPPPVVKPAQLPPPAAPEKRPRIRN